MTTKAKEAPELELSDTQYDMRAEQDIPLTVHGNGKDYETRHRVAPLTDDRFFKLIDQIATAEKTVAKTAKVTTAYHGPKEMLYDELAVSVEGYKKRPDFKEGVHFTHKKEVIDGLLFVNFPAEDREAADEGWDIDALVNIPFHAMFSGTLITNMVHSFRPETKAEMDEFLGLEFNQPDPNQLASAKRQSRERRLADLGRRLLHSSEGYVPGSDIPAWHLARTTEMFFLRQIAQAGKL